MLIRNKQCIVFDIEVFINCFHCTCYNTETEAIYKFEVSERKNEIKELCGFFATTNFYFVGYNNIHYDNPIINYCLEFFSDCNFPYWKICNSIFNLSKVITNKESDLELWKRWKYATKFPTLDLLTMLYSTALRVSLKEMQVTMHYKNVQEFITDWQSPLSVDKIDEMIQYNLNDVMSTTELLNRCKKDIELRITIGNEYNIDCLSKDGVGIGVELLKTKYIQATGIDWNTLKNLRSPADYIKLSEVILPQISYEDKILQDLLTEMKNSTVSAGRNAWNKKIIYAGIKISVGVGGIHSINEPEVITVKDDECLAESDVNSLYPSLICQYNFIPPHLNKKVFYEIYNNFRLERIADKLAGRKTEADTKKLVLNSVTGNYQNEYSWLYSPFAVMQIRINGQLILLKLVEQLYKAGCTIYQINTDAVLYKFKKSNKESIESIIKQYEIKTGLNFGTDYFKYWYQLAVNDYFAVTVNNEIIEKGCFITSVKLGKGLTPKIIPKAVQAYFLHNTPVKEFIENCTDIKDFLMSEKTGKQWTVEYNNKTQQSTNRFYASTDGAYLWKWKDTPEGKSYQNMLASSGVTLLNTFNEIPIKDRKINYRYYIREALSLIEELKPRQLSLF